MFTALAFVGTKAKLSKTAQLAEKILKNPVFITNPPCGDVN